MKFARAAAVAAVAAAVMMVILAANPAVTTAQEKKEQGKKSGGKGKSWDESVDAAIAFLRTTQAEDGSWSKASHQTPCVMTRRSRSKAGIRKITPANISAR